MQLSARSFRGLSLLFNVMVRECDADCDWRGAKDALVYSSKVFHLLEAESRDGGRCSSSSSGHAGVCSNGSDGGHGGHTGSSGGGASGRGESSSRSDGRGRRKRRYLVSAVQRQQLWRKSGFWVWYLMQELTDQKALIKARDSARVPTSADREEGSAGPPANIDTADASSPASSASSSASSASPSASSPSPSAAAAVACSPLKMGGAGRRRTRTPSLIRKEMQLYAYQLINRIVYTQHSLALPLSFSRQFVTEACSLQGLAREKAGSLIETARLLHSDRE